MRCAIIRNRLWKLCECAACLRHWPHFDGLRGDPAFAAVLDEQEARNAAQSRQLANQGLLHTPEAVRQIDDLTYDPFVD